MADDPRWVEVLDALESDARTAVDGDLDRTSVTTPPHDLGPLPPALRARAVAVVDALEVAGLAVERQLRSIRNELVRVQRSVTPRSHAPAHELSGGFDARA